MKIAIVTRTLSGMGLAGLAMLALAGPASSTTIFPRRLVEVADLSGPVVSPDGRSAAFRLEQASVERNTYDSVWYVQNLDGTSPPRRVADGGVPLRDSAGISIPASATWSPDGRWIYYRALLNGRIDIWRAAVDGSGAEPITIDSADVRDFSLSADGGTLRYSVGVTRQEVIDAEQTEYDRGIRIDETVPIGQSLFRSGYIEGRPATQRFGGVWFDRASLLAEVPDRWRAVNLTTREKQDLAPSDRPARPPSALDLPKGLPEPWKSASDPASGRIAWLTRVGEAQGAREKPNAQLAMLPDKKVREPVVCRAALCTGQAISDIQWRPHSDEVLFTVTDPDEGLAQSVFRWNVRTGAVYPVARSRGLIGGGRERSSACGVSAEVLVCVAAEADGPPRLERIDLETGERHVLFDPNEALARDVANTVPARLLRWTDANGQAFTGQLFPARRMGEVPPPLFVTYYSCSGFLRGGVGDEWPLVTLAEQGIAALCINSAPYRVDAVERYDQGLSAVESVVALLASEGEIDRARVGMGGLSFGSEVTYWTLMRSDMLKAASVSSVAISPTYYLLGSLKGDAFFEGLKTLWQLGTPDDTPERWRIISPVFNLDSIQAPILMQMSEQEYLHALDYTIPLIRARRADLYVFPNEPHQKFQPRHKLAVYERNLDWFRFWLQDYEDPDPTKREQSMHWRSMKHGSAKHAVAAGSQDES